MPVTAGSGDLLALLALKSAEMKNYVHRLERLLACMDQTQTLLREILRGKRNKSTEKTERRLWQLDTEFGAALDQLGWKFETLPMHPTHTQHFQFPRLRVIVHRENGSLWLYDEWRAAWAALTDRIRVAHEEAKVQGEALLTVGELGTVETSGSAKLPLDGTEIALLDELYRAEAFDRGSAVPVNELAIRIGSVGEDVVRLRAERLNGHGLVAARPSKGGGQYLTDEGRTYCETHVRPATTNRGQSRPA